MNLIHGFDSNSPLINPDMKLMQQHSYAKVLRDLFLDSWSKATVGNLYELMSAASTQSGKQWKGLTEYIDEIAIKGKEYRPATDHQYQFLTYFADAVHLIDKHQIPTHQRVIDLILDDDGFIEANTHERLIHNALNFANIYGKEF